MAHFRGREKEEKHKHTLSVRQRSGFRKERAAIIQVCTRYHELAKFWVMRSDSISFVCRIDIYRRRGIKIRAFFALAFARRIMKTHSFLGQQEVSRARMAHSLARQRAIARTLLISIKATSGKNFAVALLDKIKTCAGKTRRAQFMMQCHSW